MTSQEFKKINNDLLALPGAKKNYTAHKSEGMRYWTYRLLRPFLKAKYAAFQKANPEAPWISPGAIYVLKKALKKDMVGFEFGSGRSTMFYAGLLKKITSIEHYKPWFEKVNELLAAKDIQNASLILVETDVPSQHLSSEAQLFTSAADYPIKDEAFSEYIDSLLRFPDQHFDFMAVDGRARNSCVIQAIPKLKPGGLLLLDNSERKRYQEAISRLSDWPSIFTTTGLTDTTIWMKP